MKLKNFAMITEDKITKVFCIANDYCKVFDAQMAKYSIYCRMKGRTIPTQSPNVMHPLVLHAHLAIHNGIVGSITGCLLIGISKGS